jgi:hypothetical protein
MIFNLPIIAAAALIPLLIGFIWYNPKTLGNAWMSAAGITEETMKGSNMALIFGLTYLFSFFASFALVGSIFHLNHVFSLVMGDPGMSDPNSEVSLFLKDVVAKYGSNFRTFKHGALHGAIVGITLALPIITVNALFERKGFKYIAINAGFWIVCFLLMGGVLCAFS